MPHEDTIVAISTAPGRAGIGIVRLSGPKSLEFASRFFRLARLDSFSDLCSHRSRLGWVYDAETLENIDQALLLFMRAPNSYTSEDVVEISCHGGSVPLGRTLGLALKAGARLAEPGEFTKRAFLAGRIDLAQAEAVCDLIEARTQASGRLAALQLEGRLSSEIRELRALLLGALAEIEAGIDFPEDDVEEVTRQNLADTLDDALNRVERLLVSAEGGRIFREGLRVAIVGRPNAGKSSLLNALLGHERAIVTDVPGTTRDAIEEAANIRGVPFVFIDTAGLRQTSDVVERIGVQRAEEARRNADVTVLVIDGQSGMSDDDHKVIQEHQKGRLLVALNKADLGICPKIAEQTRALSGGAAVIEISALTKEGLTALEASLYDMVVGSGFDITASAIVTNARHQACLGEAKTRLLQARLALKAEIPYDLLSIDLRAALDASGNIIGESVGEDLLDEIFSRFCIGK